MEMLWCRIEADVYFWWAVVPRYLWLPDRRGKAETICPNNLLERHKPNDWLAIFWSTMSEWIGSQQEVDQVWEIRNIRYPGHKSCKTRKYG